MTIFLCKAEEPTETVLLPPEAEPSPKTTDFWTPAPIVTLLPKIKLSLEPLAILFLLPIIYELLPSFLYWYCPLNSPIPKAPEEFPVTWYSVPKANDFSPKFLSGIRLPLPSSFNLPTIFVYPKAELYSPLAVFSNPKAELNFPLAVLPFPKAELIFPLAVLLFPKAELSSPLAVLATPASVLSVPVPPWKTGAE